MGTVRRFAATPSFVNRFRSRLLPGATVFGAIFLLGAVTASAHIDPDPVAVEAGAIATVTFGVEHGCDDSPTTGLAIKVPDGITDAAAVAKDGWTTSTAAGVVSFTGGNLDAATPDTFSITFTAPAAPGTVHFPIVQTCAAGQTAWIEIPADGGDEPEHPAPAVLITDGPPTSAELSPAGHDEETVATGAADHHAEEAAVTTVAATSHDDSSNTGAIVGVIAAIVIIGGAGAVFVTRRRGRTPSA